MRVFAVLLFTLAFIPAARAHNPDTSYARVRIFDNRLETRLTFDIFSLQRIVPEIDANGDAGLSREELRRAAPAIQKFLRAHVGIEVDERAADLGEAKDPFWPLDAPDPIPAAAWHTNEALVSFGFDKPLASSPKSVALMFDTFRTLSERHSVLGFFDYRGQITEVVFTLAEPDYLFDVAFAAQAMSAANAMPPMREQPPKPEIPAEASPERPGTAGTGNSPFTAGHTSQRGNVNDSPAWSYFKRGVAHILSGYDHLCFLLALLIVSRLKPLVAIVTSFTVAHSITLALAALQIVSIPTRVIESAVALTIVYVGIENLWHSNLSRRWVLTFCFGLIHGFSFANTLKAHELPPDAKAKCLFLFNLGVEAGQLAVVLVFVPAAVLIARSEHAARARRGISAAIALVGLACFVDRAFNLRLMPF